MRPAPPASFTEAVPSVPVTAESTASPSELTTAMNARGIAVPPESVTVIVTAAALAM